MSEIRGPVRCAYPGCSYVRHGCYTMVAWQWLLKAHWWEQHGGNPPEGLP